VIRGPIEANLMALESWGRVLHYRKGSEAIGVSWNLWQLKTIICFNQKQNAEATS